MLKDGPIPSRVIDEMSVTFLPQFLGAFPYALSVPWRSMARGLCWSRTRPRIPQPPRIDAAQALSPNNSRLLLALGGSQAIFFGSTPASSRARPGSSSLYRHPHAPPLFPHLAVALQGRLVVLFELRPQGAALLQGGKDAPPASRGAPRGEVPALPAPLELALEGRQGDAEGADDLLPLGIPRSTASNAFSLRSFEYAPLRRSSHAAHTIRKSL